MPYEKIILKPGVNTQNTPLLNEAGWSESQLIRIFQGLMQKIGGWARIVNTALQGTCRGILAWADLQSNVYVACGTEQRLQVYSSGNLYDITPVRKTVNVTPSYSTVSGSNVVTVTDTGNGANATDGVLILNPISVGGLVLQGNYEIQSIVDANNYTIDAASNAASTVNNGGAAAKFDTLNTSSTVTVTLNNHGYSASDIYTVYIQTIVGGITILVGPYVVQTVTNANVFTITAIGSASSTTSGFENAGNSRIEYLLPAGLLSAGSSAGYGEGGYGFGGYGIGNPSSTASPLRQWSLGAWGQQLIASPSNGAVYEWDPSLGLFENPAVIISQAPSHNTGLFIAMPEQQIVSYGATDPNTSNQDPMLIRWCDVADYTDWIASSTNQAGSFRLPRGSKIVGGLQGPQYGLLWTDLGMWAMNYVQPPLVYGFNELSEGCGLISMRAMCVLGVDIPWMSQNGFFVYSGGSIQPLPCDVWDIIFGNLTKTQLDKICMGPNSHFNEFFVFYPSLSGSGENDSYVKYTKGGYWDYGELVRTAWTDQSAFGNPLGVDGNALIQQHEIGYDADGAPLISSIISGWFKLNDGQLYIYIDRMIPNFVLTGNATVQITIYTADYPEDTPQSKTFDVTSQTEYLIIRTRSRLARIQISGTGDLGTFWRLGEMLYLAAGAGKR